MQAVESSLHELLPEPVTKMAAAMLDPVPKMAATMPDPVPKMAE